MSKYNEAKTKAIYDGCKAYVVKLQCATDKSIHFFNGFFYGDGDHIVTTGRIVNFNGATKYQAVFFEGTAFQKCYDLTLVRAGNFVRDDISSSGTPYKVFNPDIAVFLCPEAAPTHPPRPFAEQVSAGVPVFVVGFKGKEEPQLSISDGIVSYHGLDCMHITAHADEGYSGSPVLSAQGFIVGMVKGSEGTSIKQVEVVSVKTIHGFLVSIGLPGFKG
jgi:hypothetical protein